MKTPILRTNQKIAKINKQKKVQNNSKEKSKVL